MIATLERMTRRKEQPKEPKQNQAKRKGAGVVRIGPNLARMIKTICDAEDITAAEIIDPLIKEHVIARYVEAIETLKAESLGLINEEEGDD